MPGTDLGDDDARDRKAVLPTAPSDLVQDPPHRPAAGRPQRAAAAAAVFVLAAPLVLTLPTAAVEQPTRTLVQAAPVRSALLGVESFDRPSSAQLDAAQVEALRARTVVRASRSTTRAVAAKQISAVAPAKPKPVPKAKKPAAPRWVRPGNGRFTSGFKMRWGRRHNGVDLAAPTGAPIVAASDGVVIYAGAMSGYGRLVLVRHSSSVVTAYGHMSKIKTSVGDRVKAGELIALIGSAGRSTGPHLHFEVRINGVKVNPQTYLAKRNVYL